MSASIPVFWRDEHEAGLKGLIEVHIYDLPRGQLHGARVCDLLLIVNRKVSKLSGGIFRSAMSLHLYGIQLSLHLHLDQILANFAGSIPRLVASMETWSCNPTNSTVRVKTLTGELSDIPCSFDDTVSYFKLRIRDIVGIFPDEQILIHKNKRLEDHKTLSSYGLVGGNTIDLLMQLSGGFTPTQDFADVSNTSILVPEDFNPNAPEWRTAWKGLNIEGVCKSSTCVAFDKMIIYPKKFDVFNLVENTAKCPMCRHTVKPVTCGFYDCAWRFDGKKASNGFSITSDWIDAVGYKYYRFDTHQKDGIAQWEGLLIVAKPREEAKLAKLIKSSESSGSSSNGVCTICWTKLGLGGAGSFVYGPCKHTFHCRCFSYVSAWCIAKDSLQSCPTCRKPMQFSTVPRSGLI